MNYSNIFPLVKQHFHTNDGDLANGYKLYIYQNNSTVPAQTFKDSSAVSENTHPIILNARGECDLWVKPNKYYKAVFKSRDNQDIYTVNDIWVPELDTDGVEDTVNKYAVGLTNEIGVSSFNTSYVPLYGVSDNDVVNGYNTAYNPSTGFYTFFEDGDYTLSFTYTGQVTGTGPFGSIRALLSLYDSDNIFIKHLQMTEGNVFVAEGSRSSGTINLHIKAIKGQKILPIVIAHGTAGTAQISTIFSSFAVYRIHKETNSGGGSGVDGELKYISTIPVASILNNLAFNQIATSTHLTSFKCPCDLDIGSALMETYISQTANGEIRMCIYDQTMNLLAYSSVAVNPINGYLVRPIVHANVEKLEANVHYYLGIQTDINNLYIGGIVASTTLNHTPLLARKFDNIGSMLPPNNLSGGSESVFRYYIGVKK